MYYSRSGKRNNLSKLQLCPICGMDSGYRVHKTEGAVDAYIVRCTSCEAETKEYTYAPAAAKAWNKGDVYKRGEAE